MYDLEMFLKENKIQRQNRTLAVTESLRDNEGKPVEWELKPVSTRENEEIRQSCMIKGEKGYVLNTSLYIARLVACSVVKPDLFNAKLQDSYGVLTPEDLVREMVDNPMEYSRLVEAVEELNGFTAVEDKIQQAKK